MSSDQAINQSKPYGKAQVDMGWQEGFELDVRDLFLMLWRRKVTIMMVVLTGVVLAALSLQFIQPRYTARSILLIETGQTGSSALPQEIQTLLSSTPYDSSVILSELEVMRSRSLAREVVERLDLLNDPEFNPRLRAVVQGQNETPFNIGFGGSAGEQSQADTESDGEANTGGGDGEFRSLTLYRSELSTLPPETVDREIASVVSEFLARLSIRSLPGSSAVQVQFTSAEPEKAALIANTLMEMYIEKRLERKFEATQKVTSWLDQRLSDLRNQVRQSERAVSDYKAANNLVEGARRTVVSAEQLSALNSQLVLAKAQRAEAEARFSQIQKLLSDKRQLATASEVVSSSLIQNLRVREADMEGRLSELSARYGPKHPEIQKVKSELRRLKASIHGEILKISKTVENEVQFAEARVKALEEGLKEISGLRNEENTAMIRLRELEREAESNRLIFDTFTQTYKQSNKKEQLEEPEARVISYAIVPGEPSFPNKMLILSLSTAIAFFIGLAIALLLEKLDNTFRSAGQLENLLGYPCYAMIPQLENMPQTHLANYVVAKPSSTVAESVRTLRMVVNLRSQKRGKKAKTVMITSSFPGEGKTTLSIWMARLAAKSGEKVVVIDTDLRRPNIHRSVGKANDHTLVEYLTGKSDLDTVIQRDDESGAHMIYARSIPNSALDLISSEKMKKLVESLKQVYDLVILDTPACLAVSDARVLATYADQSLYGVAWDRTPREVVMSGVKQFADMGHENMGFVLTSVDVKRHLRYGYGDTVYYYGRYKEYFAD
jgi:capsular exopolysaccharide synthesis family protein